MKTYFECWIGVAKVLFSQALAGEPELDESDPAPLPESSFGFSVHLAGDVAGRFEVLLDAAILEAPLLGEGVDQKAGWGELLREAVDAAAGELLATTGRACRVERFEETAGGGEASRAFRLQSGDRSFAISVCDETREPQPSAGREAAGSTEEPAAKISPGIELLLDVELEVSLRFGCRELPLGEILDLGPGDVVQLDRHVADPVDLIVGDKIVARGEVVLVNGNFGLRVTEVAAPRKRLESIRCLF
jgi:flagellar motor switch protein FliN/FliY